MDEIRGVPARDINRLWEEFRVLRHDFRNLDMVARAHMALPLHESVSAMQARLDDLVERLKEVEEMQAAFGVDEMSPRERAVLPAMARSWIVHGEADDKREESTMQRMRVLTAYGTIVSALMAVAAVVIAWVVSHH